MLRRAVCAALGYVCLVAPSFAYPQQISFATTDSGLSVTVSGIAGVQAIADSSPGAAMGTAVVNQVLVGNRVDEGNIARLSMILNSVLDNSGIVNLNQNSGNLNNQANVVVLALAESGNVQGVQIRTGVQHLNNSITVAGGTRQDLIVNSFGGTTGIVSVNQAAGSLNQMANVVAVGIGLAFDPGVVAVGDTTLETVTGNNTLTQNRPSSTRLDTLINSFAGFRGAALLSQSAGDLNIIRNVLGIGVTVVALP